MLSAGPEKCNNTGSIVQRCNVCPKYIILFIMVYICEFLPSESHTLLSILFRIHRVSRWTDMVLTWKWPLENIVIYTNKFCWFYTYFVNYFTIQFFTFCIVVTFVISCVTCVECGKWFFIQDKIKTISWRQSIFRKLSLFKSLFLQLFFSIFEENFIVISYIFKNITYVRRRCSFRISLMHFVSILANTFSKRNLNFTIKIFT